MFSHRALATLRRPALNINRARALRRQSNIQGGHQTYFQPPPELAKPKWRWRILRGTILSLLSLSVGTYIGSNAILKALNMTTADLKKLIKDPDTEETLTAMSTEDIVALEAMRSMTFALRGGDFGLREIAESLDYFASISHYADVISHDSKLPSNLPCEDQYTNGAVTFKQGPEWVYWGIFDGHAGPRTAYELNTNLVLATLDSIGSHIYGDGGTTTNEEVCSAIQEAFTTFDDTILRDAISAGLSTLDQSKSRAVTSISWADQGSCALLALYDKTKSVLHIANTGDSRAVLGRWDAEQGKFIATALTNDHTGFNEDEVARLSREHPGEDIIDPKTGRIFGLAVTRAFGDSRWKVEDSVQDFWHRNFWANAARPNGVIKTPPYLTAEPEVKSIDIEKGDFIIMASDGLWDKLSNQQAVDLVQMWLDKHQPKDAFTAHREPEPAMPLLIPLNKEYGDDVYYDSEQKILNWKNDEKYFTVQDFHCASHLVRNALGGNRHTLVAGVMSVPPGKSRDVRDDITVSVVFFGADTDGLEKQAPESTRVYEASPVPGR